MKQGKTSPPNINQHYVFISCGMIGPGRISCIADVCSKLHDQMSYYEMIGQRHRNEIQANIVARTVLSTYPIRINGTRFFIKFKCPRPRYGFISRHGILHYFGYFIILFGNITSYCSNVAVSCFNAMLNIIMYLVCLTAPCEWSIVIIRQSK